MILNTQIWAEVVEAAKLRLLSENKEDWFGAVERAEIEFKRCPHWAWDNGILRMNTTTGGRYEITPENHHCKAQANNHKACKHLAAWKLYKRYLEKLNNGNN